MELVLDAGRSSGLQGKRYELRYEYFQSFLHTTARTAVKVRIKIFDNTEREQ